MKKTYLWIILAGILWGTSGIFVRWLTPYGFTSFPLTAFRGGIAFLSIAGYCLLRERSAFRIRKEQWPVFLGIGVIQFVTAACYFLCMQMTSVATAVVLMCTAPVYVILFSVLVTKEPLSLPKGIAIGGMLLGCVLVSGLIDGAVFHGWGIAIGILSGISKGSYSLLVKKALKQGSSPLSPVLCGSLFMWLLALPSIRWPIVGAAVSQAPFSLLPLLLGLGLVTFVFPFFLYAKGLRHMEPGTASTLSVVEPMAAALFSVAIFQEPPALLQTVGIVLILLSIILLGMADNRKPNP